MDKQEKARIEIIGKAIREGRKKRGWSQSQLAEFMGVHTTLVSRWETYKGVPTGDDLLKLAKELDIVHLLFADYFPEHADLDEPFSVKNEIARLKQENLEIKQRLSKIEGAAKDVENVKTV